MKTIEDFIERYGREIVDTNLGAMGEWKLEYLLYRQAIEKRKGGYVIAIQETWVIQKVGRKKEEVKKFLPVLYPEVMKEIDNFLNDRDELEIKSIDELVNEFQPTL